MISGKRLSGSVIPYILRRLTYAVIVLWAAYTVAWLLLFVLPGDPVEIMVNSRDTANQVIVVDDQRRALEAEYGFDKPWLIQYVTMAARAITGDFGTSLVHKREVVDVVGGALPDTLAMTGLALVFSLLGGTTVAALAAYTRNTFVRTVLSALPAVGLSLPTFWVGLVLLQLFSYDLGWFPSVGGGGIRSAVLPALTLAVPGSALFAQVFYRSLSRTKNEPFVNYLAARGVPRIRAFSLHIVRAGASSIVTVFGLAVGGMFVGAVVVETVFSRQGVGRILQESVTRQDLPVLLCLVSLSAAVYAVSNLAVDLLYPLIDPRVTRIAATERQG